MLTKKKIEQRICSLLSDLILVDIQPTKVLLFGSYSKGLATEQSDMDLAIWADQFTGYRSIDIERISTIISKYPLLELHPFKSNEKYNPFMDEILQTGIDYSSLISYQKSKVNN
jgi:predicted nucleotidyltransferase